MLSNTRNGKGSAIIELGPALFIFLIIIFFPLMDLVGISADYAFANLLHNAEVREVSVNVSTDLVTAVGNQAQTAAVSQGATATAAAAAAAMAAITSAGASSAETIAENADRNTINALTGYAKFCGLSINDVGNTSVLSHAIQYLPDSSTSGNITHVSVTTIVSFRPFLRIPILPGVPGLNANMQFSITSSAPQEEMGLNG